MKIRNLENENVRAGRDSIISFEFMRFGKRTQIVYLVSIIFGTPASLST